MQPPVVLGFEIDDEITVGVAGRIEPVVKFGSILDDGRWVVTGASGCIKSAGSETCESRGPVENVFVPQRPASGRRTKKPPVPGSCREGRNRVAGAAIS